MERRSDAQPRVEFVLGFPVIESIAGKYCVGFRRERVDQVSTKLFLRIVLPGNFPDNHIAGIVCSILLKP